MFEVQKLFHTEGLDAIKAHGIDARDYPNHGLILLDYNQIEAKNNDIIAEECRGLIIDYNGNIVRKGFNRFYNFTQAGTENFDFEHSIAYEKADGSLCFVYFCPQTNRFEIGTRGTAFAEGPANFHPTFRDFMLAAMGRTEEQFQNDCSKMDKGTTRLYEACGPDNRIVTGYKENHLVALAYIHNKTGCEVVAPPARYEKSCGWNVRPVREYRFNTKEDCLRAIDDLTGLEEGYVCYNELTGERVKIKSPTYLAAHRLRGNGLTINSVCELVVMGEVDEYLATFGEDAPKFLPAQEMLKQMMAELSLHYIQTRELQTQKDFALRVKDLPLSAVLFKVRKNGSDPFHEFNQFPVSKRADWLKERLLQTVQYRAVQVSEGRMGTTYFNKVHTEEHT